MFDLIGFTIALALGSAIADHIVIKGRIANGDRRELDHGPLAAIRACLFIAYSCWLCYDGIDPWQVVLVSPACAAIFATVHRVTLNLLRGLHPLYLSPSSLYDSVFLRLSFGIPRLELIEAWHVYSMSRRTLRAGLLAYIFEAVVAAAFIYLATLRA